jgi:hypothetical protein
MHAPPQDHCPENGARTARHSDCGERGIEREQLERTTIDPADPLDDISIVRSTRDNDAAGFWCFVSLGKPLCSATRASCGMKNAPNGWKCPPPFRDYHQPRRQGQSMEPSLMATRNQMAWDF